MTQRTLPLEAETSVSGSAHSTPLTFANILILGAPEFKELKIKLTSNKPQLSPKVWLNLALTVAWPVLQTYRNAFHQYQELFSAFFCIFPHLWVSNSSWSQEPLSQTLLTPSTPTIPSSSPTFTGKFQPILNDQSASATSASVLETAGTSLATSLRLSTEIVTASGKSGLLERDSI